VYALEMGSSHCSAQLGLSLAKKLGPSRTIWYVNDLPGCRSWKNYGSVLLSIEEAQIFSISYMVEGALPPGLILVDTSRSVRVSIVTV
jgi:hypothetical protein